MGKIIDYILGRNKAKKWSTEDLADGIEHLLDAHVLSEQFQAFLEIERKYGKAPPCPYFNGVYYQCGDQRSQYFQGAPEDAESHCKSYRTGKGVASSPDHVRSRVAGWQNGCGNFFSSSELVVLLAQNKYYVPDVTDYGHMSNTEGRVTTPPKKKRGTPEDVYGESW